VNELAEKLITLEKSALDQWIHANPQGYLNIFAQDITYFDPYQETRIDGLAAMEVLFEGVRGVQLPFSEPRYEMIGPVVQHYGDVAVLTFNLINYGRVNGETESILARWNSTEVYRLVGAEWKISHSHWSYIKPAVQPAQ
jgi:ketosteroid isomerase-like protein